MTPDTWFDQLASALAGEADVAGIPPLVSDDERDALLDLARVAAHTSERWTAPISTFVVGAALHDRSSQERAATLRRLVTVLEPAAPTDAD
jgi:hypothetical protein